MCLVFLEVFLRYFYYEDSGLFFLYSKFSQPDDPFLSDPPIFINTEYSHFSLKPNTSVRFAKDGFDVFIKIDKNGFRTMPILNDFNKTILTLGDSFTFGYGVNDNETYPFFLQKRFNDTRVINAGYTDGYSPDSEYLYLIKEGLKLSPDLVIVGIFVGNDLEDISENVWEETNEGLPVKVSSTKIYVNEDNRLRQRRIIFGFGTLNEKLSKFSRLYFFIYNRFVNWWSMRREPVHSYYYLEKYSESFDKLKNLLVKMNELSLNKSIFVIFPDKEQTENELWENYQEHFRGHRLDRFQPQKQILDFCKSANLICFDPFPELVAQQKIEGLFLEKDGHMNSKGNKFFADLLYNFITNKEILD